VDERVSGVELLLRSRSFFHGPLSGSTNPLSTRILFLDNSDFESDIYVRESIPGAVRTYIALSHRRDTGQQLITTKANLKSELQPDSLSNLSRTYRFEVCFSCDELLAGIRLWLRAMYVLTAPGIDSRT